MLARSVIAAPIWLCVSPALAKERIALRIGNRDYKRGVGRLVNPLNDIHIVGNALRKVGFKLMKRVRMQRGLTYSKPWIAVRQGLRKPVRMPLASSTTAAMALRCVELTT